jgi:hypothetical protein
MKKVILITLLIILSLFLNFLRLHLAENNPENRCGRFGGGWAPYWTLKDCNGNLLTPDSELVIDEKTCWCRVANTCWNGWECIKRP